MRHYEEPQRDANNNKHQHIKKNTNLAVITSNHIIMDFLPLSEYTERGATKNLAANVPNLNIMGSSEICKIYSHKIKT